MENVDIKKLFESIKYCNFYIKEKKTLISKTNFYKYKSFIVKYLIENRNELGINVFVPRIDIQDGEKRYPIDLTYKDCYLGIHQKEDNNQYLEEFLPENYETKKYVKTVTPPTNEEYNPQKMEEYIKYIIRVCLYDWNIYSISEDKREIIIKLILLFGKDYSFTAFGEYEILISSKSTNKQIRRSFRKFRGLNDEEIINKFETYKLKLV